MRYTRRQFIKISSAGLAGSSMIKLGLGPTKEALAEVRQYKLQKAKEVRNTCTYCSVGCGLLIYSQGDGSMNARESIIHIEGDPDHPVNRGTLCPKGAGLLDYVHSESRLRYPEYRKPGAKEWQRISWEEAFSRIATLMKKDRDANFIAKNEQGETVNRWLSTGFLAASAASNEAGYLTHKIVRSLGILAFDNQARV
jgi:anaerobic selenocysteine-containing dehydrogenase